MERARVTIESLAHGGDGVAHLPDGRAVFVSMSCPGDEVTLEVTESHERWARGRLVSLDTPGPDRVTPPCPYFGACGGCQWQHVAYPRQLHEKRDTLVQSLRRIARLEDPLVGPVVPSPAEYGYRNKIELSVSGEGRSLQLGFARAGSTDLVPVDTCLLLPRGATGLPGSLSGALRFLGSRGVQDLVRATLRISTSGERSVDIWTTAGPFPRALAVKVIAEATGARTITRVIVRGPGAKRDVTRVEVLAGPGAWAESLGDDRYLVSAPSFFQVNTAAATALRQTALEMLDCDGSMRVADLYAGVGTFTLPMARAAGETIAVEGSKHALLDLRRNLDRARLDADVAPGDAAHVLEGLGHLDAALIDPPRSGLADAAIRALVGARIARLVYVSCDPATLARDVKRLAEEAGYVPRRFVPVDLFPQTYHLETATLLESS